MTASAQVGARVRRARGIRTRESILRAAVDLASVEGLEGLSIGRLAQELGMSKSGLFAHFGSKEELQLAAIDTANEMIIEHVIRPAIANPRGMPRLWSLCSRWLEHVEKKLFRGGCFFTAASFEYDSRTGVVRDRIALMMRTWLGTLSRAVEGARACGHIKASVDPDQLAFEIETVAIGAFWAFLLLDDQEAMAKARATILNRLKSLATPKCPRFAR
ncbi:MAG TPA: helix-turn-helix domain-containing protein [Candidatus Angelobacter sp.]|nr:helix-turn-helix domain-containing protein [Candidatus Angelobacter sp.]